MRALALLAAAVAVAGCGGGGSTQPEGLVEALESHGVTLRAATPEPPGVLGVRSTVYRVDGGELHVFAFQSESRARHAAELVAPDGYMVTTESGINQMVDWVAPPHWFRYGRQIAVYLGSDAKTIDALEAIAGPQFAGS
jgi:hypothetical protein